MKDILKKYSFLINIAGFLIVLVLVFFFVINPLQKSIQSNSDEIQKKIIDDNISKSRISQIPDMEKIEEAFSENKNSLDIILDSSNEVDFIKKIESLAEETGNKIVLKIDDGKGNNPKKSVVTAKDSDDIKANLNYTKYLSMQINLEGNYEQALEFIHKLENMNYYVDIISINMIKNAQDQTGENTSGTSPFEANNPKTKSDTTGLSNINNMIESSLGVVVYLKN
jgi:hypothetical protein